MDHASFALRQHLLVLHQAGIRHLLPGSAPAIPDSAVPADPGDVGSAPNSDTYLVPVLDQSPWVGFLGKFPHGARSLWTYDGLGQDLTGQPSAERRRTLGRLLAAAGLPKGFVGFFPCCLPVDGALAWHQDVFLEALSRLNPSSVVLFEDSRTHPLVQSLTGTAAPVLLQYTSLEVFSRMSDDELQATAVKLRDSIFQCP